VDPRLFAQVFVPLVPPLLVPLVPLLVPPLLVPPPLLVLLGAAQIRW
jgi:hypothetical protein